MPFAIALHLTAAVIWVGGMFLAWMILRPVAAGLLAPPERLALWSRVFRRFFPWAWAAVAVLFGTGLWMLFAVFGGMAGAGWHIHLMLGSGLAMTAIFAYIWFVPYPRLLATVQTEAWPEGGNHLSRIRRLIGINLILGLVTVVIASAGRYL